MSNVQATPGRFARVQDWWWDVDGFDGDCLSVLAALCKFDLKGDGIVFPSQSTIASMVRKSRSWVNKRVARLVEIGLITKQHVRRDNGGESSCVYRINYTKDGAAARTDTFSCDTGGTGGVADNDSKNKNPNTNTQVSIHDWEPEPATVSKMMETGTEAEMERCISRFRSRVEKKGYNYSDFDAGLLTWWEEDRAKLKSRPQGGNTTQRPPAAPVETNALADDLREPVERVLNGNGLPGMLGDDYRFRVALGVLSREVEPAVYKLWIDALELVGIKDGTLVLRAPNAFHAERVRVHHEDTIVSACRRVGFAFERLTLRGIM